MLLADAPNNLKLGLNFHTMLHFKALILPSFDDHAEYLESLPLDEGPKHFLSGGRTPPAGRSRHIQAPCLSE
jgi:hypothetical protein